MHTILYLFLFQIDYNYNNPFQFPWTPANIYMTNGFAANNPSMAFTTPRPLLQHHQAPAGFPVMYSGQRFPPGSVFPFGMGETFNTNGVNWNNYPFQNQNVSQMQNQQGQVQVNTMNSHAGDPQTFTNNENDNSNNSNGTSKNGNGVVKGQNLEYNGRDDTNSVPRKEKQDCEQDKMSDQIAVKVLSLLSGGNIIQMAISSLQSNPMPSVKKSQPVPNASDTDVSIECSDSESETEKSDPEDGNSKGHTPNSVR